MTELEAEEILQAWSDRLAKLPPYWHDKLLPMMIAFLIGPLLISGFSSTTLIICGVILGVSAVLRLSTAPLMSQFEEQRKEGNAPEERQMRSYVLVTVAYFSLMQLAGSFLFLYLSFLLTNVLPPSQARGVVLSMLALCGVAIATVLMYPAFYAKSQIGNLIFWLVTPGNIWPENMKSPLLNAIMIVAVISAVFLLKLIDNGVIPYLIVIVPFGAVFGIVALTVATSGLHHLIKLAGAPLDLAGEG